MYKEPDHYDKIQQMIDDAIKDHENRIGTNGIITALFVCPLLILLLVALFIHDYQLLHLIK